MVNKPFAQSLHRLVMGVFTYMLTVGEKISPARIRVLEAFTTARTIFILGSKIIQVFNLRFA